MGATAADAVAASAAPTDRAAASVNPRGGPVRPRMCQWDRGLLACPRPAACRTHGARAAQVDTETIDKEVAFAKAPDEHPADRPQTLDITLSLHQRGLEWDPEEIAQQERERTERALRSVRTADVWRERRQRMGLDRQPRHTAMF